VGFCSAQWGYVQTEIFQLETGGSTLSEIIVECQKCGKSITMEEIYRMKFRCTGRFPEDEPVRNAQRGEKHRQCTESMKVIQRQSASLHIPEPVTLLTIPKYDNTLSYNLQEPKVSPIIRTTLDDIREFYSGEIPKEKLLQVLAKNLRNNSIPDEITGRISSYIEEKGTRAFCELFESLHDEKKDLWILFMRNLNHCPATGGRQNISLCLFPQKRQRTTECFPGSAYIL